MAELGSGRRQKALGLTDCSAPWLLTVLLVLTVCDHAWGRTLPLQQKIPWTATTVGTSSLDDLVRSGHLFCCVDSRLAAGAWE